MTIQSISVTAIIWSKVCSHFGLDARPQVGMDTFWYSASGHDLAEHPLANLGRDVVDGGNNKRSRYPCPLVLLYILHARVIYTIRWFDLA